MIENDMFPRTEDDTPATAATILERRLIWLLLSWSPALLAIRMLAVYTNHGNILNSPWLWLYQVGMLLSPIVAAVLVVIALRHHPVLYRFLKVAVAFSLCLMVLTNYTSAAIASHGDFFQAWTKDYNSYSFQPLANQLVDLFSRYVTLPSFLGPLTDYNMPLLLFYTVIQQYSLLTGPYFLLLLLLTPSFLALPIFWLWVLLSALYVVLPSRAWRWMRGRGRPSVRGALSSLLVLCLLLTSCTASPGEETMEALGFSGGNIGQGGLMGGDNNGNVYYRSEADHWCLYTAKLDGSAKQKLSDDVPCDINVLHGWVYYANYRDGFSIYRIRTDGTGHARLKSGYCTDLYVVGSHIYYDVRDEANASHIHRMDVDGGNDELVVSEARLSYYYGGSLYYTNSRLYLCKYDLAKGASIQLNDKYSHYVTVNQNGVYYWNPDENTFVHMNYEGGDSKVILSGGDHFNVCDKYVYYMKYGGNYDFYRLSLETGEKVQLSSFMAGSFDTSGKIIENPVPGASDENNVLHEGGSSTYVIEGRAFIRATLRQSLLQNGRLDCLVRLDGAGTLQPWD